MSHVPSIAQSHVYNVMGGVSMIEMAHYDRSSVVFVVVVVAPIFSVDRWALEHDVAIFVQHRDMRCVNPAHPFGRSNNW